MSDKYCVQQKGYTVTGKAKKITLATDKKKIRDCTHTNMMRGKMSTVMNMTDNLL